MAYTDRDGMIDAFGETELIQRTDRAEPPTGEIDDDVLDGAIADATSVIALSSTSSSISPVGGSARSVRWISSASPKAPIMPSRSV